VAQEAPAQSLRAARLSVGMRVSQVADLLGVDGDLVTRWEDSGYEDAPLSVVRRLAETLGVTVKLG
jgi:predicted transcriptional regulator